MPRPALAPLSLL